MTVKTETDTVADTKTDRKLPRKFTDGYTKHAVPTGSGKRKSVDCNDAVAELLRGKNEEALEAVAKEHGLHDDWKRWRSTLNLGMSRMNLGNKIRRHLAKKVSEKPAA